MVDEEIKIELRSELSQLDLLHDKLEEFGEELGLHQKSFFHIILVMDELCTNIISYGFKDDEVHLIKISARHREGILELRIEDDGEPFNPTEFTPPDLSCPIEDRDTGGLGCYLINHLMDEVVYERVDNRNILTLKKMIKNSCGEK